MLQLFRNRATAAAGAAGPAWLGPGRQLGSEAPGRVQQRTLVGVPKSFESPLDTSPYLDTTAFATIDEYRQMRNFPAHLPIEYFEEYGSRKMTKDFKEHIECMEEAEIAAAPKNTTWQVLAATTLERYPKITPALTEEDIAHGKFIEEMMVAKSALYQTEIDQDVKRADEARRIAEGGEDRRVAAELASDDFVAASRETRADREDDRLSLNRKLADKLFLMVKHEGGEMRMPQALNQEGESLRETAERSLEGVVSEDTKVHFLGNTPCHVETIEFGSDHPLASQFKGSKVFYYRAALAEGTATVTLDSKDYGGYQWLTRAEMEEANVEFFCSIGVFAY